MREDVPFIDQEEAKKLNGRKSIRQITGYFNKPGPVACGRKVKSRRIFSSRCLPKSLCSFCLATFDPVTPPKYGEEVARQLPNSRRVVIPQAGHIPDGLTDPGCLDRIILEFMDKGNARDLDTSCVERMAAPPFATSATKRL